MASVHKKKDSKYWHGAWRDKDGRLVLRSTKQTDRNKALAIALEFEQFEKIAASGEATEAQARAVLDGVLKRAKAGTLKSVSTKTFLEEWIEAKEAAKKSDATLARYEGVKALFLKSIGSKANKSITALCPRDVELFMASRQRAKVASSTIVCDVKILRDALTRARKQGLIPSNPAEAVQLPAMRTIQRGTFTPEEIHLLVEAATGEWKTVILLGYFTGQRLGDVCRVEWSAVDLSAGTITFIQQKTETKVVIPIHPTLQEHLLKIAGSDTPSKFVTPHMAGLGVGGRHGLSEGFKRVMRKAGLDLGTVQGTGRRRISTKSFHALRHSFTSALANAGVSPELRMRLTGHKSAAVHQGYTHHELSVLREAIAKLSKV